jgi:hypothetical protein
MEVDIKVRKAITVTPTGTPTISITFMKPMFNIEQEEMLVVTHEDIHGELMSSTISVEELTDRYGKDIISDVLKQLSDNKEPKDEDKSSL